MVEYLVLYFFELIIEYLFIGENSSAQLTYLNTIALSKSFFRGCLVAVGAWLGCLVGWLIERGIIRARHYLYASCLCTSIFCALKNTFFSFQVLQFLHFIKKNNLFLKRKKNENKWFPLQNCDFKFLSTAVKFCFGMERYTVKGWINSNGTTLKSNVYQLMKNKRYYFN